MAKTILAIIEKIAACFKNFGVTNTLLSLLIALIIIVGGLELWNGNTISAINDWKTEERVVNKDIFNKSRDFYAGLKQYMRSEVNKSNCAYMMLVEFHNGSENIITNIDFCKFDVTLEVQNDERPYVCIDDYTNQNVFKYDILLDDKVYDEGIATYTSDDLKSIDAYLLKNIKLYNSDIDFMAISPIEVNDRIVGMVVGFYTDEKSYNMKHFLQVKTKIENKFKVETKNFGEIRENRKNR